MIVEATGIATGNDHKPRGQRVRAAMLEAIRGVNDPDAARARALEARATERARCQAEERQADTERKLEKERSALHPNLARIAFLEERLAELQGG